MEFFNRTAFCAFAAGLGFALGGCEPSGQNAADDEKEPHFVLGQNRVNAMDYSGAVEAFEESLETNPHSAPAHYQLAMLYSEHETNPVAAIYHYQQYLRFDPKAPNAAAVQRVITNCMQHLAANVLQLPSSPAMQQSLQQLTDKTNNCRTRWTNGVHIMPARRRRQKPISRQWPAVLHRNRFQQQLRRSCWSQIQIYR